MVVDRRLAIYFYVGKVSRPGPRGALGDGKRRARQIYLKAAHRRTGLRVGIVVPGRAIAV